MTRWEYLFEDVHADNIQQAADSNGSIGWELVSAELHNGWWYCAYKRPMPPSSVDQEKK